MKFPLVDIIDDFVIETCLYSKDFVPQEGDWKAGEIGTVASSDRYTLKEWKRAEKQHKKNDGHDEYEITGEELELYKTKKDAIIGHKKYVELEKKGELEIL